MLILESFQKNRWLPLVLTLLLTGYQLVRVIVFVNVYGGLEHDSGWSLGAARSLAERGAYTSMVSTIEDPRTPGGINVDDKFDIQAPDGRVWLRTSTSIGPASIVPDALVLKFFGVNFWTLRTGPLLFYTFFLFLAAYVLYQLTGLGAIILFHAFLFFYPHLSIFLAYEGLGEMPSMVYQLAAFLTFAVAVGRQRHRLTYFFVAGLLVGLASNAKMLALLPMSGLFLWAGLLWWYRRKTSFKEVVALVSGLVVVQVGWELTQLVILTRLTSFELYLRHAQQRWLGFLDEGSGLGEQSRSGPEFIWDKFLLLQEVSQSQPWLVVTIFLVVLLGGGAAWWLVQSQSWRQNLVGPMWLGWLANTAWYVGLAKTGWTRHYWFGLILAALLLSVIPLLLIRSGRLQTRKWRIRMIGLGLLLLGLLGWNFAAQPHVWYLFLPDEIVPYWQQKRADNGYQATMPWIIIPRSQQEPVVAYIQQMPPEARVYYPYAHKAAEIATLTGRINYPINRRNYPGVTPHPADILLIHPYIVSAWIHDPVMRQDLLNQVAQVCPQPVLKNDFYMICLVKSLRLPQGQSSRLDNLNIPQPQKVVADFSGSRRNF